MTTTRCTWCENTTPQHKHYAVHIRDHHGRALGRLTPEGTATTRNLYALVLSQKRANQLAANITATGDHHARPIPF